MKKLLFLTLALTMFASCKKGDEPNPDNSALVVGIVMPTGEFHVNDLVTIKGVGFLQGDAIVLRAAAKSSVDINAVVTEVTESQIVFTMPYSVAAGQTHVVLKREVKEQTLGEITIANRPPIKIYGLQKSGRPYWTKLYEIDNTTGVATHVTTFADGYQLVTPLVIGHTMYATNHADRSIVSYNIDTKEFKKVSDRISNQHAYDALGVIDGKLHALVVVDDIVKLISIDAVTSAKTEVGSFGKLDNPICVNGWSVIAGGFAYDAKNKKIIIEGFWDSAQSPTSARSVLRTIILDLSTKTIAYFPLDDDLTSHFYLMRGSQLCRMYQDENNDTGSFTGYLELINDKHQVEAQLAVVTDLKSSFTYDAEEDFMYLYVADGWCSVDLKTKPATFKTVKGEEQPIEDLFIIR